MCPDIAQTLPGSRGRNIFNITRYQPEKDKKAWDQALKEAENATVFHRHEFLAYHPPERFNNHHLMFWTGDEPRVILTGAVREKNGKPALHSYPGASYGGFAYPPGMSFHQVSFLIESLLKYASSEGFAEIALTMTPVIYSVWPADIVGFHLLKAGFKYVKREITQAIPLYYPDGDIFKTLCAKTRTAVRKAVKSKLRYEEDIPLTDENLETFYPLLLDNRKRLGVTPTHSLDELKRLRDLIPEHLSLSLVWHQKTPVAGILNFICNNRVCLIFYICHDWDYQEYRPVPLLMYKTIQWAFRRNFSHLDFGTSTLNMDPNWGLIKFKENFGSLGYFRDTLSIEL